MNPVTTGSLPIPARELSLRNTLSSRQVFGWRELADGRTWRGVLGNRVVDLHQSDHLSFQVQAVTDDAVSVEMALSQFFRIDVSLWDVHQIWSRQSRVYPARENHAGLALIQAIRKYPGVRLLRPPFFQALITQLFLVSGDLEAPTRLSVLSKAFGTFLGKVDDEEFFAFPTLAQLAPIKETTLAIHFPPVLAKRLYRAIGWIIDRGGEPWLTRMASQDEMVRSIVRMEMKQLVANIDVVEADILMHRLFMAFSNHTQFGMTLRPDLKIDFIGCSEYLLR